MSHPSTALRHAAIPGFVLLALLLGAMSFAAANDDLSLFDGRTLDGWEGDSQYWSIQDGAIVGVIPPGQTLNHNTWLVWKAGELRDFDLRLQVRLTGAAAANSGIQFRCQVENINHVSGYQADLDMGATWLGRIYDEHGRALLVERGSRVLIAPDGTRTTETFAPAGQYAVLFRENDWNEYRIVATGDHVAVFVNGTLFSELQDQQTGEQDLSGQLAFQLHSGPETRVEFRNIRLEHLKADSDRLKPFRIQPAPEKMPDETPGGELPKGDDGKALNMSFESGRLDGWEATGDAFARQPVRDDGISQRWSGQSSGKEGDYFIGGYEIVRDAGTGTLTSAAFRVTHPWASFLIGGGEASSTRVEILRRDGDEETVIHTATGTNREQMRRVAVDLTSQQGRMIAVRLVDENSGGWGHLNFDDFRFHSDRPSTAERPTVWRSTANPLLQHLGPNTHGRDLGNRGAETLKQMFVPAGFSVDVIAAEPELHQPMAFTFDARGRLWVVEGHSYPQKRPAGEGLDRILIFTDTDHDGTFETRQTFTEGLNLVSGLEVGFGGVWVGAAPELLFIADADGDDVPDREPQVLLDGFGYADTHETLNSFLWGPDGWLYGNQGVFNTSRIGRPGESDEQRTALSAGVWRYHPTQHVFEVFAHGGSNQWGLDYDLHGQIFMTHCRSYWGRGATTHVMRDGHYWNQVNGGYAPFISAQAPAGFPELQNFLLASARYGHGEGGAGKKGSRDVYGGHSHVGTMIYLGDNWPDEFRNHLFTHNLHGHQINHQINLREAGGYNTVHAGTDMLFCADQQYIGVDLQYGPDGAVYLSDWYDPRHCHNPDVEQWDRGNGRMYRLKYDATWKPAAVDFTTASDLQLAETQRDRNEWKVRTARLVLAERAARRPIDAEAVGQLTELAQSAADPSSRLRAVWTLSVVNALRTDLLLRLMTDDSEYVRAWAVQLATQLQCDGQRLTGADVKPPEDLAAALRHQATSDNSLFVRRTLASAITRVDSRTGWELAEILSQQPENADDRDLPAIVWYGLAGLMPQQPDRALQIADTTPLPALRNWIHWYAAAGSDSGRAAIVSMIAAASESEQRRLLTLLEFGIRGMRGLKEPAGWTAIAATLYAAPDRAVRTTAESIGAAFGDTELYERMRRVLRDSQSPLAARKHALSIVASDTAPANLPVFLKLLDMPQLAAQVLPLLSRYNDPTVAESVLNRLPAWQNQESAAALELLSGRAAWSDALLDHIAAGSIDKSLLTAYYVRKMVSLEDDTLNARLIKEWGALGSTSEERRHDIRKFVAEYDSAPLWAYSAGSGAAHFKKLCATCHEPTEQNAAIAPRLAGSGSKGIGYLVENVLDPNAVIGRDFQARVIVTTTGLVITGLVESETESAITVRTQTGSTTVARDEIEDIAISQNSFMPENLLNTLNDREQIELFKYLMSL